MTAQATTRLAGGTPYTSAPAGAVT
jgi:hypothetical protein